MLIVIIGESGSGKGLFANFLSELGIEEILTYTERPPRHELDNHIFVDRGEYENCNNIIAQTKFGDYHYWLTLNQIDWHKPQSVTVDINGLEQVRNNERLSRLRIEAVHIHADRKKRMARMIDGYKKQGISHINAIFKAEERMNRDKGFEFIPNVTAISNNGTEEELKVLAKKFYDTIV